MRQTVCRWYWAWDYDKEEKWLNEMSAKALALVGVGFCKYSFKETVPVFFNKIDRLEQLEA